MNTFSSILEVSDPFALPQNHLSDYLGLRNEVLTDYFFGLKELDEQVYRALMETGLITFAPMSSQLIHILNQRGSENLAFQTITNLLSISQQHPGPIQLSAALPEGGVPDGTVKFTITQVAEYEPQIEGFELQPQIQLRVSGNLDWEKDKHLLLNEPILIRNRKGEPVTQGLHNYGGGLVTTDYKKDDVLFHGASGSFGITSGDFISLMVKKLQGDGLFPDQLRVSTNMGNNQNNFTY